MRTRATVSEPACVSGDGCTNSCRLEHPSGANDSRNRQRTKKSNRMSTPASMPDNPQRPDAGVAGARGPSWARNRPDSQQVRGLRLTSSSSKSTVKSLPVTAASPLARKPMEDNGQRHLPEPRTAPRFPPWPTLPPSNSRSKLFSRNRLRKTIRKALASRGCQHSSEKSAQHTVDVVSSRALAGTAGQGVSAGQGVRGGGAQKNLRLCRVWRF